MPALEFLDTNVLVYSYDSANPEKREVARTLVRKATAGECLISEQVLAEFSSTMLHKLSPALSPRTLTNLLHVLGPIKVISPDADMVLRAVEAHGQYQVHFYDGMIIAAAEKGRCTKIWSEDLNPGQEYFGIPVENPFARCV